MKDQKFRLDLGYCRYNSTKLYRVVGVNNDYIGNWTTSETEAKNELTQL